MCANSLNQGRRLRLSRRQPAMRALEPSRKMHPTECGKSDMRREGRRHDASRYLLRAVAEFRRTQQDREESPYPVACRFPISSLAEDYPDAEVAGSLTARYATDLASSHGFMSTRESDRNRCKKGTRT